MLETGERAAGARYTMEKNEVLSAVLASTGETVSMSASASQTVEDVTTRLTELTRLKSIILLFGYVDLKKQQTLESFFESGGNSEQLSLAVSQRRGVAVRARGSDASATSTGGFHFDRFAICCSICQRSPLAKRDS
jgi:hypothetical protein